MWNLSSKKISLYLLGYLFVLTCMLQAQLNGEECCGKVDLSPAYVHIDVLESNKTIHRMDLAAIKADLSWKIWSGFVVKPTILYGHGKNKDEVLQGGSGLGFCYPVNDQLYVTPLVGFNYGTIKTVLSFDNPYDPSSKLKIDEKLRSFSPYVGVEVYYTICKGFRVGGTIQYAWSRTKTTIKPQLDPNFKRNSHSEGFTYSCLLEYDLNDHWSINTGAAYNLSLTKEKHGMRIWGGKVGISYWF